MIGYSSGLLPAWAELKENTTVLIWIITFKSVGLALPLPIVFVDSASQPSLIYLFNSLLPLGSTALVESWIDKVEGRKIFACAQLKSPDGKLTYVTANALFIQLDPQGKK